MLNISREELAQVAGVAERTISDFEAGRRRPIPATLSAIRSALERAGIQFVEENGGGPGVRLKRGRAPDEVEPGKHDSRP